MIRLRGILVALLLLALVACTQGSHEPGVLRLGEDEEPDSLNLMYGHTLAADGVACMLYSFLLRNDPNGNYIPDLATVVPTTRNGGISADGKTIVVHLRKGVQWADGAPLTAADWIFTYHAVNNPANNVKTRYGWDTIASATAPDPYTIVIHLKHPSVEVFGILAMGGAGYPPMPAHLLAKLPNLNTAAVNSAPLSSGPYILQAWNRGDSLIFVPNPRYFRGAPHLREVIWKIVPDVNTLYNQLARHEIDVYPMVNANSVPRLHDISGIHVVKTLSAAWRHLGLNMSKPILARLPVREAIAEGVDWASINATIFHGFDQLAVSDIFPKSWAAPSLPPYRYNPADARALLDRDGWRVGPGGIRVRNGQKLELTLTATTGHQENDQSEVVIQSMLRAIGVGIVVRNYPANLMFAMDGPIYTGKYDLEWSTEYNGVDPDNSGNWAGSFIPPNGANTSWLNDPIVNRTSLAAASTFDEATRKRLYQVEEQRIRALVPAVFVSWRNTYTAISDDVHGYVPSSFVADSWNSWEWSI
jgi:peptide/nickel transport system substrate-binding protein